MMRKWGLKYMVGYGFSFLNWLIEPDPRQYGSFGNGSAMRVAAAGWLYASIEETRNIAVATAEVTHNHPEGIKGAEATVSAIYLARMGYSKIDIKDYITGKFGYNLNQSLDSIRSNHKMNATCQVTVPASIISFL